jgi:hypothetical protein
MAAIEEGQYSFDDSHPHFEGVYDAFKKIDNRSVPDAVMAPCPETLRFEHKRRMFNKTPRKNPLLAKTDESDFSVFDREGGPGGTPGGKDDKA